MFTPQEDRIYHAQTDRGDNTVKYLRAHFFDKSGEQGASSCCCVQHSCCRVFQNISLPQNHKSLVYALFKAVFIRYVSTSEQLPLSAWCLYVYVCMNIYVCNGWARINSALALLPTRSTLCEVLTAVTVKNVVFWDIKTQFVLHRRHITSPLQSPAG
jgi:hypothetical protein